MNEIELLRQLNQRYETKSSDILHFVSVGQRNCKSIGEHRSYQAHFYRLQEPAPEFAKKLFVEPMLENKIRYLASNLNLDVHFQNDPPLVSENCRGQGGYSKDR